MPSRQPLAEGLHNHPPRCCCPLLHGTPEQYRICPACPMHGDLARGVDCPQCLQPAGRPHTDYCTLDPGKVWNGVLPEPEPKLVCRRCFGYGVIASPYVGRYPCPDCAAPACAYPAANAGDGRGCGHDDCPMHGDLGLVSPDEALKRGWCHECGRPQHP